MKAFQKRSVLSRSHKTTSAERASTVMREYTPEAIVGALTIERETAGFLETLSPG